MKKNIRWTAILLLGTLWAACQLPERQSPGVTIQLGSEGRTVVADWSSQVDSYVISLVSRDDYETITRTVTSSGTVHFSGVQTGIWDVTVTALRDETPLAAGSFEGLEVSSSGAASATVTLTASRDGQGSYAFKLKIPVEADVTSVVGQLYDMDGQTVGDAADPALDTETDEDYAIVSFAGEDLDGGLYRLALTFKRGSNIVGQFSEAVNIWANVLSNQWLAPGGTLEAERTLETSDLAESNAHLDNLTISGDYPLSPAFSSVVTSYQVAALPGAVFALSATQSIPGQTIELKAGDDGWVDFPSGSTTEELTITPDFAWQVRVTAPDHTVLTYTITLRVADVIYMTTGATGGGPPVDSTAYEPGDTVTIKGNPNALSRTGYQFAGWNTQADALGTTVIAGATLTATEEPLELYPIWLENKYSFESYLNYPYPGSYLILTGCNPRPVGTYVVPNGVTSLGNRAIYGSGITSVSVPSTVIAFDSGAFQFCPDLTEFTIPPSVKTLNMVAFQQTGLATLNIPATLTGTLDGAPAGGAAFSSYTVDDENPNYKAVDGLLYNKAGTKLIAIPNATSGTFVIPDGVTSLGNLVFNETQVTEVQIPASTTDIGFVNLYGADNVTAFHVSEDNTQFSSRDGMVFNKAGTTLLVVPAGLSGEVAFPDGTVEIADNASSRLTKVTSFTFPESLTTIRQGGMMNCIAVITLEIPDTVHTIESSAFFASHGLHVLIIHGTPTLGADLVAYSRNLQRVRLTSSTPPDMEWGGAFDGMPSGTVIQVPADAVETYKAADGWSAYADKIVAAPAP